ncbi:MAG: hypothetical protein IJL60_09875 [Clostridiales bacterium]|nr:hypothetical protein [Clostridiales bacterium]MBQ6270926.1 hypothetical protein [Clostridiales bacterium]
MNGNGFLQAMTNLDDDFVMEVMPQTEKITSDAKRRVKWQVVAIAAACLAIVGGGVLAANYFAGKEEKEATTPISNQTAAGIGMEETNTESAKVTDELNTGKEETVQETKDHMKDAKAGETALETRDPDARTGDQSVRERCQFVSSIGDLAKVYDSTGELEKDADLIVVGTVVRQENYYLQHTVHQFAWIKIEEVKAGSANLGDTILIQQIGGYATYKEWIENTQFEGKPGDGDPTIDENQITAYGIDGYYPVVEGDRVLLYLKETGDTYEPENSKIYVPVGTYFGVFYWCEERNQFVFPEPYCFAPTDDETEPWKDHLKDHPVMTVDG